MPEEEVYEGRDGLFVDYDEESGVITLEWDEKTHPQYNIFCSMSSKEFVQILLNAAEAPHEPEKTTGL